MQSTTNYQLVKQELTDKADITQISGNWDIIDAELKRQKDEDARLDGEKFDKTGGTVTGNVTISSGGLAVTGGTKTDTFQATGNGTVEGALTVTGKVTANNDLEVTGNETVGGTLSVTGKLTANGGLDITGNADLSGVLSVQTLQALLANAMRSRADVTRGTNPAAMTYSHWSIYDKAGWGVDANRLGRVQYSVNSDGTATMAMYVNKFSTIGSEEPNGIIVQWTNEGKARVSLTHHPEASSNDKQVATTNWVRSLTATTSEYGLVRLASEADVLQETSTTVMDVPLAYELNDFRRISKAYSVGDKVNCAFKFEYFLECTQAGTTSAESLDTRNVTFGQEITDGTCKWVVRAHLKSVNGSVPDANGNVTIETGGVKTVNGTTPDSSGNVNVATYTHPNSGVTAGTYNKVTVNAQGHVTSASNVSFATVATSGSYNDLSNKPSIPAAYSVSLKSTRNEAGTWSITGLKTYRPLFIIHKRTTTVNSSTAWVAIGSGSAHNDPTTSNHIYVLGMGSGFNSTNVVVVIPTSTTVSLNVTNAGDDDTLYAFQ